MELIHAVAGSLESSDVQVLVEPYDKLEIIIESVVKERYGRHIKETVEEILKENKITNVRIRLIDKGALDCTIRARVASAINRATKGLIPYEWEKVNG